MSDWSISDYRPATARSLPVVPARAPTRRLPTRARSTRTRSPELQARFDKISKFYENQSGPKHPLTMPATSRYKPPERNRDAPSLLGQVWNEVANIPAGFIGLGASAGRTLASPVTLTVDALKGEIGKHAEGGFWNEVGHYAPLPVQMGGSLYDTSRRIAPLVSGNPWEARKTFQEYKQASDEGRIVSMVLEDASNLSLAAGAVAKGLGATSSVRPLGAGAAAEMEAAALTGSRFSRRPRPVSSAVLDDLSMQWDDAARLVDETPRPVRSVVGENRRWRAEAVQDAPGAPVRYEATRKGRGLAGALERRAPTVAKGTERVARGLDRAARWGDVADQVQFTWPIRGVGWAAKKTGVPQAVSRGAAIVTRRLAETENGGLLAKGAQLLTPEARALRSQTRDVVGSTQQLEVEAQRHAVGAAKIAQETNLTEAQSRVAMASVSGILDPLARIVEAEPGVDVQSLINRAYDGVTLELRPTVADVNTYVDYRQGRLDDTTTAAIRDVSTAQRFQSMRRTAAVTEAGALNPEQLQPELRPSVIEAERKRNESLAGRAQRQHEQVLPAAAKAERRANAQAAINATENLPTPDTIKAAKAGQKAGIAEQRYNVAVKQHEAVVRDLERAVDEYIEADAWNTEAIEKAAAEVDRLTQDANRLAEAVRRAARREEVARPLTRASGEIAEQLPENVGRPVADTSGAPTSGELKRAARAAADEVVADLEGQMQELWPSMGPPRERFTPDSADLSKLPDRKRHEWRPGEQQIENDARVSSSWDFMEGWSDEQRQRYIKEGFLVSRFDIKARNASAPDQYTAGKFGTVDEAMEAYFDLADRIIEARRSRPGAKAGVNQETVQRIANDHQMSYDVVDAALNGDAKTYRAAMETEVNKSLDWMRNNYLELDAGSRAGLDETLRAELEAGADAYDLLMMADEYLTAFGQPGMSDVLHHEIGWANVAPDDIVNWLIESSDPPKGVATAIAAERGPAQLELLQALADERKSLQAAYRAAGADVRGAVRDLERAEGAQVRTDINADAQIARTENREAKVAAEVDRLNDLTMNAQLEATEAAPPTARGWQRRKQYDRDPETGQVIEEREVRSPNERALVTEGALGNDAARKAQVASAAAARQRKYTIKATEVEGELSQSFQRRLRERVNAPAINGMIRWVDRSAARLGGWVQDNGKGKPPSVTGFAGVIARKYGIEQEVVAALTDMEATAKQAGTDIWPADIGAAVKAELDARGIVVDGVDMTRFDDSVRAAQTADEMRQAVVDARDSGTELNAVYRVYDAARGLEGHPNDIINGIESRMQRYERTRARYLDRLMDVWAEAMPAQYRSVAQHGRRGVKALLDEAEAINKAEPGAGDVLIRLAEDVPTTIDQIIAAGIDPTHMIGGLAPVRSRTGAGSGIRARKLRAERESRTGLQTLDPERVARLEADEMGQIIRNNAAKFATQHFGRPLGRVLAPQIAEWEAEHPGVRLGPREYKAMAEEAGWRLAPDEGQIAGPQTMLIPEAAHKILSADQSSPNAIGRYLQFTNRGLKYGVLGLSPKWLTGNAVGNLAMAAGYGGVSPITLVRTLDEIRRTEGGLAALWEQGGMPSWAPDPLTSHGLAYGDHQLMWGQLESAVEAGAAEGAGPISKSRAAVANVVGRSYQINEFTDNMYRSAVYLAKLRDGIPSEVAMQQTLRAMGDFTRMNPTERWITRNVLPFYPWLRHQMQATLRLPLYSPARAGMLLHFMDLFAEPDMEPEMYAMLNSRMPIGNSYVFFGGLNPFGDPSKLGLDPSGEGMNALGPGIKVPFQLLAGVELGADDPSVSRPQDQLTTLNPFGQPTRTSALSRILGGDIKGGLGEVGYQLSGQLPQTRSIRNLALGTDQWRYASGDVGGEQDRNDVIPRSLIEIGRGLNLPGLPDWSREDIEDMNKNLERAKRDLERRQRYNR